MMGSLFGVEIPLAVQIFIAFIVVVALIGLAAWLIRRFNANQIGNQTARGRAPRLAVIEAGIVDNRRRLVLIRRDNTEHLIMIGGPTDIVIEQNILRTQSPARGVAAERVSEDEESWAALPPPAEPALQPSARMLRQPPAAQAPEPLAAPAAPGPLRRFAERRPGETGHDIDKLGNLAAQLSTRPAPFKTEPTAQHAPDIRGEVKPDLRAPQPMAAPVAAPVTAQPARPAAPVSPPRPAAEKPVVDPLAAKPADKAAPKPEPKTDDVFSSLEEEMASLLGRPQGKS